MHYAFCYPHPRLMHRWTTGVMKFKKKRKKRKLEVEEFYSHAFPHTSAFEFQKPFRVLIRTYIQLIDSSILLEIFKFTFSRVAWYSLISTPTGHPGATAHLLTPSSPSPPFDIPSYHFIASFDSGFFCAFFLRHSTILLTKMVVNTRQMIDTSPFFVQHRSLSLSAVLVVFFLVN